MQRPFVLLVSLLGLWGCQSTAPTTDPFLRTTVPPPGTGAATTTADPYYPASHSTALPPQGVTPASAPAVVVPPPSKFAPPGGSYNYQSSVDRPRAGSSGIRRSSSGAEAASTASVADSKARANNAAATSAPNNAFAASPAIRQAAPAAGVALAAATAPWVEDEASHDDWAKAMKKADESPIRVAGFHEVVSTPAAVSVAAGRARTKAIAAARAAEAIEQDDASELADENNSQEYRPVADNTVAGGFAANRSAAAGDEGTVIRILEPTSQRTERVEAAEPAEAAAWTSKAADPFAKTVSQESAEGAFKVAFKDATPVVQDLSKLPRAELLSRTWPTTSPKTAAETGLTRIVTGGTLHDTAMDRSTSAFTASGNGDSSYGYNPDYQSLRGKLEYSQSSRQWKLRYIPIDGQTDQFGGSVVIPASTKLEGFQPGDFVVVEGAPGSGRSSQGFSPTYDLRQIAKLR